MPPRRARLARNGKPPSALVQPRRERCKPGLYGGGVDHPQRPVTERRVGLASEPIAEQRSRITAS
jgi:hypothetical protein